MQNDINNIQITYIYIVNRTSSSINIQYVICTNPGSIKDIERKEILRCPNIFIINYIIWYTFPLDNLHSNQL